MSDESNAQDRPKSGGSWTPPPPGATPPPPAASVPASYQPPTDPTGGVPTTKGPGASITLSPGLVLGLIALVGVVLSLFLKESVQEGVDGTSLWDRLGELWSIAAIVAAVAVLVPALRTMVNVSEKLAWTIAAAGAGFLVLWWVLFVLPNISLNVAFLATIGVAAAVATAWVAPGNPNKDSSAAS